MNRQNIKNEAKAAIKDKWFIMFVILAVVSVVSGGTLFFLAPIGLFGVYLITTDLLNGKDINANRFTETIRDLNHALKLIVLFFVQALIIAIGYVLLIIPGIIFNYMYSQALYIMMDNPEIDVMEALRRSKEMMKGHKMELFIFQLSFIGHILLIGITLGIWSVYALPFFSVSTVNYYLHLKTNDLNVIDVEVI